MTIRILVDADACPVKAEIYRVAERRAVPVSVVSNSPFRVPVGPLVERVVVHGGFDAADDWIAEAADARAVVITAAILLADRCPDPVSPSRTRRDGADFGRVQGARRERWTSIVTRRATQE